jgi:hypothetical protein
MMLLEPTPQNAPPALLTSQHQKSQELLHTNLETLSTQPTTFQPAPEVDLKPSLPHSLLPHLVQAPTL